MQHRQRRTLVLVGTAVFALVIATGCGQRDARADGAAANGPASSAGPGAALVEPTASPSPAATTATEVPAPQATPPTPTGAPFVAPDLTAIERLLDDLDAALGADATADSDEGSAP
jgi:hypothetical protein